MKKERESTLRPAEGRPVAEGSVVQGAKREGDTVARRLKKQITINIDVEAIAYFKAQSEATGIPYQTLINLYLVDCAETHRTLTMAWPRTAE